MECLKPQYLSETEKNMPPKIKFTEAHKSVQIQKQVEDLCPKDNGQCFS